MPSGELAALAAASLFALSSTFFTLAGRRVGTSIVNRGRLLLALAIAVLLHGVSRGEPLPLGAGSRAWSWLALSGVIGYALGDASLFRAYVLIGPALSMLIFALAPVMAALLGWGLLGESLRPADWAGIVVTLLGIAWVASERRRREFYGRPASYRAGLLFAAGGALGQALGLVTAKIGLEEGVVPQSANVIRLLGGTTWVWIAAFASSRALEAPTAFRRDSRAALFTIAGSAFGPVIGVWCSLAAIERAPIGIASTLMSLTPIFLLPIARIVFFEPITLRAVAGTAVALSGAAILLQD